MDKLGANQRKTGCVHATYIHVDLDLPCGASLWLFPPLDGCLGALTCLGVTLALLLFICMDKEVLLWESSSVV